MKIVTIIGARPQFIKAAMISRAIIEHNRHSEGERIEEKILHTGQHYDRNMSEIFFNRLGIPQPTWKLHCGGIGSHAKMTAQMLVEIEKALLESMPDQVLVYGDTNSTLSGALAATQLHIPVAHVEAGLRSFNRKMPEEINRVLTDHIASHLFCPTYAAIRNLHDEGITRNVFHSGDVMYDAAMTFGKVAEEQSAIMSTLQLNRRSFYLCTVHRAENTDDKDRLTQIVHALTEIATPDKPVIWPLHPRTELYLDTYRLRETLASHPAVRIIDPVDYIDMVMLEKEAATILTDSGGVQKEAYFHRTPCITLREETEWTETIEAGWNRLAGYKTGKIIQSLHIESERREIEEYGDGHAAEKIIKALCS